MHTTNTIYFTKGFENPVFWDILPKENTMGSAQHFSGFSALSTNALMRTQQKQVADTLKKLDINNPVVADIANDILIELHAQCKQDITISHTGDNELLIYRSIDGEYRNIIIDEDADIVFMHIPKDRRNTYNELHPFMMVNASVLASKL